MCDTGPRTAPVFAEQQYTGQHTGPGIVPAQQFAGQHTVQFTPVPVPTQHYTGQHTVQYTDVPHLVEAPPAEQQYNGQHTWQSTAGPTPTEQQYNEQHTGQYTNVPTPTEQPYSGQHAGHYPSVPTPAEQQYTGQHAGQYTAGPTPAQQHSGQHTRQYTAGPTPAEQQYNAQHSGQYPAGLMPTGQQYNVQQPGQYAGQQTGQYTVGSTPPGHNMPPGVVPGWQGDPAAPAPAPAPHSMMAAGHAPMVMPAPGSTSAAGPVLPQGQQYYCPPDMVTAGSVAEQLHDPNGSSMVTAGHAPMPGMVGPAPHNMPVTAGPAAGPYGPQDQQSMMHEGSMMAAAASALQQYPGAMHAPHSMMAAGPVQHPGGMQSGPWAGGQYGQAGSQQQHGMGMLGHGQGQPGYSNYC